MTGFANGCDLLKAQPAEGLSAIRKVLAGFGRIVALLRTGIQRRPLLQDLALEIDAICELFCKQYDLTVSIRIAPVYRFGMLRTLRSPDWTRNGKRGNRHGIT